MVLSGFCWREGHEARRHQVGVGSVQPNAAPQIKLFDRKGSARNADIMNYRFHLASRISLQAV